MSLNFKTASGPAMYVVCLRLRNDGFDIVSDLNINSLEEVMMC